MEIYVDIGRGYVSADKNKSKDQPIGFIPVDSIYSPITRVKFGVTDTRVGNVTNYDRLTLEVWTDGALGPDEAVTSAAEILINYLALFKTTNVPKIQGAKKVANPMRKERNRPCSRCPLTIWTSPSVPTIASDGPASTR